MSASDSNSYALDGFFQALFAYNSLILSGAVLIVYDTILTFDIELEIIWRRKFTLVSVLYVLNRYGQAVYYTLAVVLLLPLTDSACRFVDTVQAVVVFAPLISWALFSAVRAYALASRNALLAVMVFVFSIMCVVPAAYYFINSDIVNSPPNGCGHSLRPDSAPTMISARVGISSNPACGRVDSARVDAEYRLSCTALPLG
ncbi:hypothetical protein C8Q76DRAFT_78096 [Earliella scabrosa]|nr:hypothetical protein C8Q76DRAFT_78096 [Earliella scabrosa]